MVADDYRYAPPHFHLRAEMEMKTAAAKADPRADEKRCREAYRQRDRLRRELDDLRLAKEAPSSRWLWSP